MVRRRSSKSAVIQSLEATTSPIYLLDEQRRIQFANPALLEWLRLTVDQVIGVRCNYHSDVSDVTAESRLAGLCPPPEAWSGKLSEGEVLCRADDGWRRRRAEFHCLDSSQSSDQVVLLVIVARDDLKTTAACGATSDKSGDWNADQLHAELVRLRSEIRRTFDLSRFWGSSWAIRQARKRVELAVGGQANVWVSGPVGSGREHIARMIHAASDSFGVTPLVTLSCPVLDEELLRTTIADLLQRCAELEIERPPSLLLLDIDQLPGEAQRGLAEVLDTSELELRALATSRESGAILVQRDGFLRELTTLLGTVEIDLPPLKERRQDIPLLIQGEVERLNAAGGRQCQGFTPDAIDVCLEHDWPGNVDELLQVVYDSFNASDGAWVTRELLPKRLFQARDAVRYALPVKETIELDSFLQSIEVELIRRALAQAKGNKSEAARLLGIARARLLRRIEQLQLDESVDDNRRG